MYKYMYSRLSGFYFSFRKEAESGCTRRRGGGEVPEPVEKQPTRVTVQAEVHRPGKL